VGEERYTCTAELTHGSAACVGSSTLCVDSDGAGSCPSLALGCTSDAASNHMYDPTATRDDGSCILVFTASAAAVLLAFLASGNGKGLDSWRAGTDPCAGELFAVLEIRLRWF
jgi:hypothetical protein